MATISEAMALAVEHHRSGRLAEAESIYLQVLTAAPNQSDALHLLGVLCSQRGQHDQAVEYIRRAIAFNPGQAVYYCNLAIAYRGQGRLDEAEASYRQALATQPNFADGWYNLGVVLRQQGRNSEAIDCYRKALDIQPNHADSLNNLGNVFIDQGQHEEAAGCFRRALEIQPRFCRALTNLGVVLRAQGKLDEAAACHQRALEIEPGYAKGHYNLGNVWNAAGRLPEAIACYRQALRLQPDYAKAHNSLGGALKDLGKPEEAAESYRRALELEPDQLLWQLRLTTLIPVVFENNEAIDAWRQQSLSAWEDLAARRARFAITELVTATSEPPLGLQYHGKDDRLLKEAYASIFANTFAEEPRAAGSGRGSIGFFVTRRHEGAFLRSMGGVLQQMTRGHFELVVICQPTGVAQLRAALPGDAIRIVAVPERLDQVAQAVREAQLDVLYHWEVGTDATNYFLPFLRLAPIQCTSWGLPETSGIAHLDYYLSSRLVEPDDADAHYTERLLLADTLLTYQRRRQLPDSPKSRTAFGFDASSHLYLCAQNLQKIQPDFDGIFDAILRRDGRGLIVLVEDSAGYAVQKLRHRFSSRLSDVADRIVFLPRQSHGDYLSLLAAADVVLDPFYFGGGFTTYDALMLDKPVVTWPTRFQRGRYAFGCYRKMGVTDCVASDVDDYVEIALKLGTDQDHREAVTARIRCAAEVLFEDSAAVTEHARIFGRLVEEAVVQRG